MRMARLTHLAGLGIARQGLGHCTSGKLLYGPSIRILERSWDAFVNVPDGNVKM